MKRIVSTLSLLALSLGSALGADEWTDLGGAHPGVNGDPTLAGTGVFEPGNSVQLNLTMAAPSAQTLLLISTSTNPVAFAGGILQVWPTVIPLIGISTNAAGAIPITAPVPALLPPSLPFYFQYVIADAAASQGVAISNAVRALTPSVSPAITGFSPTSGLVGTVIDVAGNYFGDDPDDICALIADSSGVVVGFTRAKTASDQGVALDLKTVVPNATSGNIMLLRGFGESLMPSVPANYYLPSPVWGFVGEGDPTVSAGTFQFSSGSSLTGCNTVHVKYEDTSGVGKTWRIKLPFAFADTCPANTELFLDFHAWFNDGKSIHFDTGIPLGLSTPTSGFFCATQIASMWEATVEDKLEEMYPTVNYNIEASVFPAMDGSMYLLFPDVDLSDAPGTQKYQTVFGYLKVCP